MMLHWLKICDIREEHGDLVHVTPHQWFDKQIQLRMGQCNVRKWVDKILPLVEESADPLGVLDLTTHSVPIAETPQAYRTYQQKTDSCIKVVLHP